MDEQPPVRPSKDDLTMKTKPAKRLPLLCTSLALTVGCGPVDDDGSFGFATQSGDGGVEASSGGVNSDASGSDAGEDGADSGVETSEVTGSAETGGDTGGESTGPLLDVGGQEGGGTSGDGTGGDGCDFVDLLFIIDNSVSMGTHQAALAAAFPSFVDEMITSLPPDTDLHVGITTTSFLNGSCSETTANCMSQSTEDEILEHYERPSDVNNGENGGQGRLFSHAGKTYFEINTSDDPAELKTWFTGAAVAAGETGCSFEMPAAGAGWALAPDNAAVNDGFLRDAGAALMLFIVTDEPDKSPGDVNEHVQRVLDAKSACGGAQCVITGGLVPEACFESPNDTTLYDFMNAFGEPPVVGLIPTLQLPGSPPPDYSGVLGPGLAQVLAEACEGIPPID